MSDFLAGEIVTVVVKQLISVSKRAYKCKASAENLATMIETVQPTIKEIQYNGEEVSPHRQDQLKVFLETLEKCRQLTEKVLKGTRWNVVRQIQHVKEMEDLEKKVSTFLKEVLITHVAVDVLHIRAAVGVGFDRTDRNFDRLSEQLKTFDTRFDRMDQRFDRMDSRFDSLRDHRGNGLREALITAEATAHDSEMRILGVGLELGKKKVKKMFFKSNDETRLFGITGMSGSGKTTLAREIMRDEDIQGYFKKQILFLTVSQSPNIEELRAIIWGFCVASLPASRKLVILDDVWTRKSLDRLIFNLPGSTTLVVSRSKFTDPKATYDVELLNEHDATSLFCLSAFEQESIPSGFNINLVKQVVEECKGLPLALKVIGASLKDRPEKYWQGAAKRLSRGEPADETHESRVFAQMEASLENLDLKTRECFLDLGAFPEDKKIPLDIIINMWVELHDLDEETAFAVLVDLSDKNLLTLVKDPRLGTLYTGYYDIFVMQHDGLRDLALHLSNSGPVSKRERLLMPKREAVLPREWERKNHEPYNARIVSIYTGEMAEMDWFDMELPKAEVLILNFSSDKYVLPPFITKMGRLRALVIINNGMSPAHLHDFSIFTNLAKLSSLWLEKVHVPELSSSTAPLKNLHKMSLIMCKINNSFDQIQIFPSLTDLTIHHCDDLVELPSAICGITSLNSISITNCSRFVEVSRNLSKLTALELLRLYACPELKSLPVEICELPSLKYLDISQCISLSSLPEELGNLSTLEKIDMRECPLMSIPNSAVSMSSLRHVICDKETLWMWEDVQKAVSGVLVEAAENY